MLDKAQKAEGLGMSAISGGIEGVSFSNIMTSGPNSTISKLYYALNRLDPDKYPIDEIAAVTRTSVKMTGFR